jgi:hypothetical protein
MDLTEWEKGDEKKVDLNEVNKLCQRAFEIRDEKSELTRQEKELNVELAEISGKLIAIFGEANLKGFDATQGRVSVADYFNVQTPKSVADKKAFAKYLETKKIFWEMATFNSKQLNSFYQKEMEIAAEEGNVDFVVPGLGGKTHTQKLRFKKKGASDESDEE